MIVVPYIAAHLKDFKLQENQMLMNKYITDENYLEVLLLSEAHTGLVDGKPVVIAGCFQISDNIGMVWALLNEDCKNHMVSATRAIKIWLDKQTTPRLETAVDRGFKEAHRWAKMLGFTNETIHGTGMVNYSPDGGTCDLYARYN